MLIEFEPDGLFALPGGRRVLLSLFPLLQTDRRQPGAASLCPFLRRVCGGTGGFLRLGAPRCGARARPYAAERRVRRVGVRRGFLATPCLVFEFYSAAVLVVFSTITKRMLIM